ncbi:MAG: acyl-ACP thioesterase domain-containing protein [Allomuricauda sp.]
MERYTETFDVVAEDLDELNHVNNIRYIEWIQDISKKHWHKVTTAEMRATMVWVVHNHNISYSKSAFLGDTLQISTYIDSNKGPISTRVVEISNKNSGKLLVKGITEWCLLDAQTFRPKRVPEEVQQLFGGKS